VPTRNDRPSFQITWPEVVRTLRKYPDIEGTVASLAARRSDEDIAQIHRLMEEHE
jgi:hypothetical protein